MAASFLLIAPAQPAGREITILNRGNEPIFWVQIGHQQNGVWSDDMLAFNDVIEVGEGKTIRLPLDQQCVFDVRARYHDQDAASQTGVDLCVASSISFDH
ncbi:MAG: hypothetical protein M3N19_11410 [Candidatus Eremiobacteraeota bacterium]|nr:hypothetical protein [Candidatus Eremiobacteraeota bacterium]